MKHVIHKYKQSFGHALAGLFWSFKMHQNFKIHGILAFIAISAGVILRITRVEMSVIIFTAVLGIAGELINTALESMTDLITKEWRQEAKIAKDVSAGMMLFIAVGSVIIAAFIFAPYVSQLFNKSV